MSNNDSWFERNAGLLNTLGHLAAIAQRRDIIDQQGAQESLLNQQLQFEKRKQEKQAREKELTDLLFEVGERCNEISQHYTSNPKMALYESITLSRHVCALGLNHRCFSSLDWKNYCENTLKTVEALHQYGPNILTDSEMSEVQDKIDKEDRYKEEEERLARCVLKEKQKRIIEQEKKTAIMVWVIAASAVILLIFWIIFLVIHYNL